MLDLIINNPYRILGVYSNTPLKNRIANINRINAFSKIGKSVSFESDLNNFIQTYPIRNENTITEAQAKINLPLESLVYSLLWFCDFNEQDKIALKNVSNNDIESAKRIWSETNNLSSIWNRGVIALCSNDFRLSYTCVSQILDNERLYKELLSILDIRIDLEIEDIKKSFLSKLGAEVDIRQIISFIPDGTIKDELIDSSIKKPLADIQTLLDNHEIKELDVDKSLQAAESLLNQTKRLLDEIIQKVGKNTPTQLIIDKVAKKINSDVNNIFGSVKDIVSTLGESKVERFIEQSIKLLNKTVTIAPSPLITTKINENIESLAKIKKDLPDLIVINIATNNNICWCCGGKSSHIHEAKYTKSETDYFRNVRTTYTRGVKIHMCSECHKELKAKEREKDIGPIWVIPVVIIECLIAMIIAVSSDEEWYTGILFIGGAHLFGIGVLVTMGLSYGLIWIYSRIRTKRQFVRQIEDHPAVKLIKEDGFR